jgi:hypothetical protein
MNTINEGDIMSKVKNNIDSNRFNMKKSSIFKGILVVSMILCCGGWVRYKNNMWVINNHKEKLMLKSMYSIRNNNPQCYVYLINQMTGNVGQYMGECIGYGIPCSTRYNDPTSRQSVNGFVREVPLAEPNGLFADKSPGRWFMMKDAENEHSLVLISSPTIVSPFKLK